MDERELPAPRPAIADGRARVLDLIDSARETERSPLATFVDLISAPTRWVRIAHPMSCFGVCTGERCFAECDDDGTRVGSSYIIIGKNGGKVRVGLELDSEEVGMLDKGVVVTAIEEALNLNGEPRVLITTPITGWMSRKVLSSRIPVMAGGS